MFPAQSPGPTRSSCFSGVVGQGVTSILRHASWVPESGHPQGWGPVGCICPIPCAPNAFKAGRSPTEAGAVPPIQSSGSRQLKPICLIWPPSMPFRGSTMSEELEQIPEDSLLAGLLQLYANVGLERRMATTSDDARRRRRSTAFTASWSADCRRVASSSMSLRPKRRMKRCAVTELRQQGCGRLERHWWVMRTRIWRAQRRLEVAINSTAVLLARVQNQLIFPHRRAAACQLRWQGLNQRACRFGASCAEFAGFTSTAIPLLIGTDPRHPSTISSDRLEL